MASRLTRTERSEAIEKLWRAGVLAHKLHSGQRELYDLYYNSDFKVQTWLIGRRFGKSTTLCILALEKCLSKPNSIVKFLSPTKLQVNNNVRPIFRELLLDCPSDIKPNFSQKDYIYYFPNGSEIQLAGSESGHAEKLRGGNSDAAFIDEAGSCSNLNDTVKSILLPTTLMTGGKIILAGTPPKDPEHEFVEFIEAAELRGSLIKKSFRDNPLLDPQQIKTLFEEVGGEQTDEARRELFCEIIRDPKVLVIPEFTLEMQADVIMEWKRPPHYDMYEGLDLGGKDLTVCMLSYYDFRQNKLVFEDEVVINFQDKDVGIKTLVDKIQASERLHFFNYLTNEQKTPHKRVSDLDYIVTGEINKLSNYQMSFEPAKKDNLDAMINEFRTKVKNKEIIINPRCKTLISHIKNAKWKKGVKSELARSADDSHYDALMAAVYTVRAVDYRRNPYPAHYGRTQRDLFGNIILGPETKKMPNMDAYAKIFNVRKKTR